MQQNGRAITIGAEDYAAVINELAVENAGLRLQIITIKRELLEALNAQQEREPVEAASPEKQN